jgi:processive 1,2-diacylglycerol beta-glucosyltransferase
LTKYFWLGDVILDVIAIRFYLFCWQKYKQEKKVIAIHKKLRQVLIISASVGAGHDQAGHALEKVIHQRYPHVRTEFIDFMDSKYTFNHLLKKVYLEMLESVPSLYNFMYQIAAQHGNVRPNAKYALFQTMQHHMEDLFAKSHPDLAIFTHPFPCGAVACIRRNGRIVTPMVAIITDFALHDMWLFHEVDEYFVATEELQQEFAARGMSHSRVHATGIPIRQGFGLNYDVSDIREKLGLSAHLPLILIMGGGLGLGSMEEALRSVNELDCSAQAVVITGKNTELFDSLRNIAGGLHQPVKVLGFVDNIPELMAAADILITKPGGLTVSEALAAGLPMVFHKPLPGQEEDNARYIIAKGAAIEASSNTALVAVLTMLLSHPQQLHTLRNCCQLMGRPQATEHIIDTINTRIGCFAID